MRLINNPKPYNELPSTKRKDYMMLKDDLIDYIDEMNIIDKKIVNNDINNLEIETLPFIV